jgi:hypothetical protein
MTTTEMVRVDDDGAKPVIDVTEALDAIVDKSEELIARQPDIFQRAGELVHVVREDGGRVRVRALGTGIARYVLSRAATWAKDGKPVHPPAHVAKCLGEKTSWLHIRRLRAVATFPPLASTGSLTTTPGYDPTTNVYFTGDIACDVPERPTLDDAKRSVAALLDITCDFPFAADGHRSASAAPFL